MHRRRFIALLGAAITAARTLSAQQKAMPIIGSLSLFSPPTNLGDLGHGPFHQGLSETGFIEGQNIVTEYRWAEGQYGRLPALAADLVSRNVDLIVTSGGTPAALAAKNATSTIPIVFAGGGDPVGFGLVDSLARPGGNLTGFSKPRRPAGAQAARAAVRADPSGDGDRPAVEPGQCGGRRAAHQVHAGSGARKGGPASGPEG